jgi:glycosyltransferase involved in cell wall biosynthesis
LLFPPGDPLALQVALSRFLDEPGLWQRLRQAGLAEVTQYSWKSIAVTQMALYRATASR